MGKFIVTVIKTEVYTTDIEVKAKNLEEAERIATDQAQDKPQNWSYEESEFTAYGEDTYEEA